MVVPVGHAGHDNGCVTTADLRGSLSAVKIPVATSIVDADVSVQEKCSIVIKVFTIQLISAKIRKTNSLYQQECWSEEKPFLEGKAADKLAYCISDNVKKGFK